MVVVRRALEFDSVVVFGSPESLGTLLGDPGGIVVVLEKSVTLRVRVKVLVSRMVIILSVNESEAMLLTKRVDSGVELLTERAVSRATLLSGRDDWSFTLPEEVALGSSMTLEVLVIVLVRRRVVVKSSPGFARRVDNGDTTTTLVCMTKLVVVVGDRPNRKLVELSSPTK